MSRIAMSPLTGAVYTGKINKAGDGWSGNKSDATSDFLGAVLQKAEFHGGSFEIRGSDGTMHTVTVTTAPQPQDTTPAGDRPLMYVRRDHVADLQSANGRSVWAESAAAWQDGCTEDLLMPVYATPQPSDAPQQGASIWGYAVFNPKEPGWPTELARTKGHADRIAVRLYAAQIVPLIAATQQPPPAEQGEDAARLDFLDEFRRQAGGSISLSGAGTVRQIIDAARAAQGQKK